MKDKIFMQRALELARLGAGHVSPNPMVGAVIVHNDKIIGEGFHQQYGQPHAEVNAVNSVTHRELLPQATIYVTLEPCAHWGKTPPCAELLVRERFARVVIGCLDPNPKVNGGGVKILENAGIPITTGVLEHECRALNKAFITSQTLHRPYITLKWAQTSDGHLDAVREQNTTAQWFTSPACRTIVHKMRAENDAIIVGRRTVELDNPSLTTRYWGGQSAKNPVRITFDSALRLKIDSAIFSPNAPTLLLTTPQNLPQTLKKFSTRPSVTPLAIDPSQNAINQLLSILHERKISSLIVEGGTQLLQSFIDAGAYDEIWRFTAAKPLSHYYPGLAPLTAPTLDEATLEKETQPQYGLEIFTRGNN